MSFLQRANEDLIIGQLDKEGNERQGTRVTKENSSLFVLYQYKNNSSGIMIAIYENEAHSETALALCEYVISNDCLPALVSMCMNSKVVIPIHPTKDSGQHEHRKKIYRYNVVRSTEANSVKHDHVLLVANVEC